MTDINLDILIPDSLSSTTAEIANLHEKIFELKQTINANPTDRLNQAAIPLLIKFHLAVNQLPASQDKETEARIKAIESCLEAISKLIQTNEQAEDVENKSLNFITNLTNLDQLSYERNYEKLAYKSKIALSLAQSTDWFINQLNRFRHFLYDMDYGTCRLARQTIISDDLENFMLIAHHQYNKKNIIVKFNEANLAAETNDEHSTKNYLHQTVTEAFKQKQTTAPESLLLEELKQALNEFGEQTEHAKRREIIGSAAQYAWQASQELVVDLLTDQNYTLQQITELTECFKAAANVIKNPHKEKNRAQLMALVYQSDYERYHCNKENYCYASLHIVSAAVMLVYAIGEAVVSHGMSLIAKFLTVSAEALSVGVGVGQLKHYEHSHVEKTVFSESMHTLFKATYYKQPTDLDKIINDNEEYNNLQKALNELEVSVNNGQAGLLQLQGREVLKNAKCLAAEIIYSPHQSKARMDKLIQCIEIATAVCNNPQDVKNVERLVTLVAKADYEARQYNQEALLIGSLLLLASIAIFAITIPGSIVTISVIGTNFSPFMLLVMSLIEFSQYSTPIKTTFSDETKLFAEYAQLSLPPEVITVEEEKQPLFASEFASNSIPAQM